MERSSSIGNRRTYVVKQVLWLSLALLCLFFFALPFVYTVKRAVSFDDLVHQLTRSQREADLLAKQISASEARQLMGGQSQELDKARREVERLKELLAQKDIEIQGLKDHLQTAKEAAQAYKEFWHFFKGQASESSVSLFGYKFVEMSAKFVGTIASVYCGVMFIWNWIKRRRELIFGAQVK